MRTLLVATDFSARGDRALRRAVLLAREFGARIVLAHIIDGDEPDDGAFAEDDAAKGLLARLAETVRTIDGVSCDVRIAASTPVAGLTRIVREVMPDLLIMGDPRRRAARDAFLGSTAELILRSARCPTLIARAVPAGHYRRFLQAIDLSPGSSGALARLAALGLADPGKERGRARGAVLHVYDCPALKLGRLAAPSGEERGFHEGEAHESAGRTVAQMLAKAGLSDMPVRLRPDRKTVAREIVEAAEEERADLIILSTRGQGGIARLVLGSVAQQVLVESAVDVLIFPPEEG